MPLPTVDSRAGKTALAAFALPLLLGLLAVSGSVLAADKQRHKSADASSGSVSIKASTEVSGYSDTDHVLVLSPSIAASISDVLAGWSISGHYLVDVVSAASVDIVSTASSHWLEYRTAGAAQGSYKVGDVTMGASGVFSSEPDYLSLAAGGTLSVDVLDKNVTPFVGFSYGRDRVGRTGLPDAFWRDKQTISGQIGATFVVDPATISSLQAEVIQETGYLAKPYRYVPLFAPAQAGSIQPGASIAEVNRLRLDLRPTEQVPDSRHRFAITSRLGHRYTGSTLRLDERVYADTWGMMASTTDFRFTFDLGRRLMVWPHARFHVQNQVAFWQQAYVAIPDASGAFGIPSIRTGDRELSALYTGTGGGGMQLKLIDDIDKPWSLLFEVDGSYTRYLNDLYMTERGAVFSTVAVEAEF
jgi:Protein of unknown function (DUF3570)